MTDILIVGLLLVIIFILVSVFVPEVLFYGAFAFCIIALVVFGILAAIAFVNDPAGSIMSLIYHNPVTEISNVMLEMMPKFSNATAVGV